MTTFDRKNSALDPVAWHEGQAAGRHGLTAVDNPYPANTEKGLAWQSGLVDGQSKPVRRVGDCSDLS
jgi:hypothetical protein